MKAIKIILYIVPLCCLFIWSCNKQEANQEPTAPYDPVTLYFDIVNENGESLLSENTEGNWEGRQIIILPNYIDYYKKVTIGYESPYHTEFAWPRIEEIANRPFFVFGKFFRNVAMTQVFNIWWPDGTEDIVQIQFSIATQDDGTQKQQVRYFWGKDRKEVEGPNFRLVKQPIFE